MKINLELLNYANIITLNLIFKEISMAIRKANTKEILPNWDLTDFYNNIVDPKLQKDLDNALKQAESLEKKYKGKIINLSAKEFLAAIKEFESLADLIGKIASYAYLSYATKVSDPKTQAFYQNTSEKINNISMHLIFFSLEVNLLTQKQVDALLENKDLAFYEPFLRDTRVWQKYQLTDKEEEIIHEKDITGRSAWVRFFDELGAKLRFPYKNKKLTLAEIIEKFTDPKEAERKIAAKSLAKTLNENIDTFTFITNILAKDKEVEDKRRGLEQPISSRNIANYVEDEVVEALISTVKGNYKNLSHRYYRIKAKWMGKKQLNFWDRSAPLAQSDEKISWQESKDIVLGAYHDFSPKMAEIAKMFFDKKWIDVPATPGKMFGAFSHGTVPSVHPYILLNYKHKIRDVMTLAHELGHGIHQYLARREGALICGTPLTLAETASVFGEQLTFRELLKREKNNKKRQELIANKVEDMLNTVVRQIAFCDFELQVHAERKKGELAKERINAIWMQVQQESLGGAIKFTKDYECFWTYISHFIHSPFYVYAYAFGDCFVNSLYAVYESGQVKNFQNKYIEALAAGGRYRYDEFLKPFGLNPKDKKFWQYGLDKISLLIDELE
jgi:oligoendopeptidase F